MRHSALRQEKSDCWEERRGDSIDVPLPIGVVENRSQTMGADDAQTESPVNEHQIDGTSYGLSRDIQ